MSDDYPFFLYVFDVHGHYGERTRIGNDTELHAAFVSIKPMIAAGREVRITDSGDDLVFHAANGKIIWPTPEQLKRAKYLT